MSLCFRLCRGWMGHCLLVIGLVAASPSGWAEVSDAKPMSSVATRRSALFTEMNDLWRNGDVKGAREAGQKLLALEREIAGPGDDRVAERHRLLMQYSLELDDNAQAKEHLEAFARLFESQHAPESWQAVDARRERAVVAKLLELPFEQRQLLFDLHRQIEQGLLTNRLDEALTAAETGARLVQELLGERHPSCVMEMANIQIVQLHKGEWEAAEERLIHLSQILQQVEHPDHPNRALLLLLLSDAFEKKGDRESAMRSAQASVAAYERAGATFKQEYCLALSLVGGLQIQKGDHPEALSPLRRAYAISVEEGLAGPAQKNVIVNYLCYALLQSARSEQQEQRWDQAETLLVEALNIAKSTWGANYFRTIDLQFDREFVQTAKAWTPENLQKYTALEALWPKIHAHVQGGQSPEALALLRQYQAGLTELLGKTSPQALRARSEVLLFLARMQDARQPRSEELEAPLDEFLADFKARFGADHPEYGQICQTLAEQLDSSDPRVIPLARDAAAAFKASWTTGSVEYAQALTHLGGLLSNDNEPETVEVLTEAIALWQRNGARGNVSHGDAVLALGVYHYEIGQPYEARLLLVDAVDLLRARPAGEGDLDLAVALNYLGNISSDRGAHRDALTYYREAIHLFESTAWNAAVRHRYPTIDSYVHFYQWTLYNAAGSHVATDNLEQAENLLLRLLKRFPEESPLFTYRSTCFSLRKIYTSQNRIADAQAMLARAAAAIKAHDPGDALINAELNLEEAELEQARGDRSTARERWEAAFANFQRIQHVDDVDASEGDFFRKKLERLVAGYEWLDDWERVVAVRRYAWPFDEAILEGWPDLLAVAKAELSLAEQVAKLDETSRERYRQMQTRTARMIQQQNRGVHDVEELWLTDSTALMEDVCQFLGQYNLPAIKYCEALAKYYEQKEEYVRAFGLLTYTFVGYVQVLGEGHSLTAHTAVQAGRVARLLGEYQRAQEFSERGLAQLQDVLGEQSIDVFQAKLELATLHADLQDFAAALPLARSAVKGYHRLWGDRNPEYAQGLELMGVISAGLHQPALARTYFQQAREALQELVPVDDPRLLKSLSNVAVSVSWDSARSDEARKLFQAALESYKSAKRDQSVDYAELLVRYGEALLGWKLYPEAEEILRQAQDTPIKSDWLAGDALREVILTRLGVCQRSLGKLEASASNLKAAEAIQRRLYGNESRRVSETLFQLATVKQLQGQTEEARLALEISLQLQQRMISEVGTLMSDESLALMLGGEESQLDLLLSLLPHSEPPEEDVTEAFLWAFRRKGLALDLSCRRSALQRSQLFDTQMVAKVNKLRLLNQEVADYAVRHSADLSPDELATIQEKLHREIADTNNELAFSLRHTGMAVPGEGGSLEAVRDKLGNDAALIEFVRIQRTAPVGSSLTSGPRYVGFVVRGGPEQKGVTFADLGDADEIEELIADLRRQTGQFSRLLRFSTEADLEASYQETAGALSNKLLGPFDKDLEGIRTLIIGPDAELCQFPFAALVDAERRYLIETYDLCYVSSSRDLLRPHGPVGQGTIVLSNPNFDATLESRREQLQKVASTDPAEMLLAMRGEEVIELRSLRWRRLPGAEKEAQDVDELLSPSVYAPVKTFLGDEALEEVLKKAHAPRILHLATHGFYVEQEVERPGLAGTDGGLRAGSGLSRLRTASNPLLRSGIVLAGANRRVFEEESPDSLEDGWVTAQEIASMDFRNTELIVLSACESGLGDLSSGQGVQGLRRAFVNAGAHSVLTSLFEVPDNETGELMRRFYTALLESQNRCQALSQAQRQLIQQRRQVHQAAHPFYWASFILLGSAE